MIIGELSWHNLTEEFPNTRFQRMWILSYKIYFTLTVTLTVIKSPEDFIVLRALFGGLRPKRKPPVETGGLKIC